VKELPELSDPPGVQIPPIVTSRSREWMSWSREWKSGLPVKMGRSQVTESCLLYILPVLLNGPTSSYTIKSMLNVESCWNLCWKSLYAEHVDNWFLKLILCYFNIYIFKTQLSTMLKVEWFYRTSTHALLHPKQ
jgi:hypothetical protein